MSKQPTDLRIYRDENGINGISLALVNTPRENGITVREDVLIPASGWFREPILSLYEALVDLAEMVDEQQPDENFEGEHE